MFLLINVKVVTDLRKNMIRRINLFLCILQYLKMFLFLPRPILSSLIKCSIQISTIKVSNVLPVWYLLIYMSQFKWCFWAAGAKNKIWLKCKFIFFARGDFMYHRLVACLARKQSKINQFWQRSSCNNVEKKPWLHQISE